MVSNEALKLRGHLVSMWCILWYLEYLLVVDGREMPWFFGGGGDGVGSELSFIFVLSHLVRVFGQGP